MELKTCEYCGTEYNENLPQCPFCGKSGHTEDDVLRKTRGTGKRGGARVAPKGAKKRRSDDRIPQWMWAVICVILGLAVLIGLAYFLISMGYIGDRETNVDVPQTSVVVPEVDPVNEPELLEPMPEEVLKPADLSCVELTLSQTGIVLDVKGSSVFLTAIPTPLETTDPVFFISGDETIATVDENGMITAVGAGQTEITVVCGSVSEICVIVCDFQEEKPEEGENPDETTGEEDPENPDEDPADAPEEEEPDEVVPPTLSSVDFTLFRPGEETTLSVNDAPEGAYVTYSSSNPDVVTVSNNGLVKAVGNGMATITVMVGDVKLTCIARCNLGITTENPDDTSTVTGILSLNLEDVSLFSQGETFTLSLRDSNGNQAAGVSWASGNGGVCSVDANGKVTALGGGTTTVTASYNGQTYKCIVRCNF